MKNSKIADCEIRLDDILPNKKKKEHLHQVWTSEVPNCRAPYSFFLNLCLLTAVFISLGVFFQPSHVESTLASLPKEAPFL